MFLNHTQYLYSRSRVYIPYNFCQKFKIALNKYIVQTPHSHNPKLNFNFRIMETDDISELEVDNELIVMISGEFGTP